MGRLSSPSPRSWSPSPKITRFRMFPALILGCNIFFMLYNAFGRPQAPTFELTATFPKKIWQSWKVDSVHFEDRDIERVRTWTKQNPKYQYEVLTDDNAESYVQYHFGASGFNRPDIVSTYLALSQPNTRIIQADLLRYLILYAEGGVWADIDVEALRPIDTFIPRGFDESQISMVVGIETDEPALKEHPILGSKAQSLCQWTFATKPRTAIMMRLINHILVWLNTMAEEQSCTIPEIEMDFDAVLTGTGPSAFTNAILAEMSKVTGETITWNHFHGLEDSMAVAGVLVLPSEAFAAGTGHSRSGNHFGQRALVKHHFHASSWTKKHQRWKHPIYDEVEKCNWKVECVRLWDANVAAFDALPEAEQLKIIEMKRFPTIKGVEPPVAEQKPVEPASAAKGASVKDMKPVGNNNVGKVVLPVPAKDESKDKPAANSPDANKASKLVEAAKKPQDKPAPKDSKPAQQKDAQDHAKQAADLLMDAAAKSNAAGQLVNQKMEHDKSLDLEDEEVEEGDAGSRIASMLMKGAPQDTDRAEGGKEKSASQLLKEAYNARSNKHDGGGGAAVAKAQSSTSAVDAAATTGTSTAGASTAQPSSSATSLQSAAAISGTVSSTSSPAAASVVSSSSTASLSALTSVSSLSEPLAASTSTPSSPEVASTSIPSSAPSSATDSNQPAPTSPAKQDTQNKPVKPEDVAKAADHAS